MLLCIRKTGYIEKIYITLQFKAKCEKDVITIVTAAYRIGRGLLAVRPQLTEEPQNSIMRRISSKLI
jgi:hypothetical protein